MNERQITRGVAIWLAYPEAAPGSMSGVLSYSSPAEGVRFHSYTELMDLLRRLSTARASADTKTPALKLAS